MPRHDTGTKEVVSILRERFPKFSKVQVSMVKNPEYGIRLVPEAESLLREKGKNITTARRRTPQKKKAPEVPPRKRVSFRLADAEYDKLKEAVKSSGYKTTQEYLEHIIQTKV